MQQEYFRRRYCIRRYSRRRYCRRRYCRRCCIRRCCIRRYCIGRYCIRRYCRRRSRKYIFRQFPLHLPWHCTGTAGHNCSLPSSDLPNKHLTPQSSQVNCSSQYFLTHVLPHFVQLRLNLAQQTLRGSNTENSQTVHMSVQGTLYIELRWTLYICNSGKVAYCLQIA